MRASYVLCQLEGGLPYSALLCHAVHLWSLTGLPMCRRAACILHLLFVLQSQFVCVRRLQGHCAHCSALLDVESLMLDVKLKDGYHVDVRGMPGAEPRCSSDGACIATAPQPLHDVWSEQHCASHMRKIGE